MPLKDKIKKLRERNADSNEKTGILNGLVVLGALAGALIAAGDKAEAAPKCDSPTHEVTDTQTTSSDGGIDTSSWDNHCWWDHSWWDHDWSNWDESWNAAL